MSTNRTRMSRGGSVALLGLAALLASANPAAAAGAGESSGGFTTFNPAKTTPDVPLCNQVASSNAVLELDNLGTFNGTAVVATHAVITMRSSFYFNPAGTFSDSLCTQPAVVRAEITVKNASQTTTICTGLGAYNRTGDNAEITTARTNTLGGTSSALTATAGSTTCGTLLSFTGLQQPCLPQPPFPDTCPTVVVPVNGGTPVSPEFVGTYDVV